eukprot:scaffold93306_cov30-Phaeocystis_antarctica.AAC.1
MPLHACLSARPDDRPYATYNSNPGRADRLPGRTSATHACAPRRGPLTLTLTLAVDRTRCELLHASVAQPSLIDFKVGPNTSRPFAQWARFKCVPFMEPSP